MHAKVIISKSQAIVHIQRVRYCMACLGPLTALPQLTLVVLARSWPQIVIDNIDIDRAKATTQDTVT
jgi:hypothetical protein